MKYAQQGQCPLMPDGYGLVVEMNWSDGTTQYMALVPWVEVEHQPGLGAKHLPLAPNNVRPSESIVLYRQLDNAPDECVVEMHSHDADEQILVLRGRMRIEFIDGTKEVLAVGEQLTIPKETPHRPVFIRHEGEAAQCMVIWHPPLKRTNIQQNVCGVFPATETKPETKK